MWKLIVSSKKVVIHWNLTLHRSCQSQSNELNIAPTLTSVTFFFFFVIFWSFPLKKEIHAGLEQHKVSKQWQNLQFKVMSVCIPWALCVFSYFWQLVICHSENQLQLIVTSQTAAHKTQRHIFTLSLSAYGWCSFCSSLLFRSCSLAWAGAKPFCCLGSSG